MNRTRIVLYFIFFQGLGCHKPVMTEDVIILTSTSNELIADNSSIDTIYAHLPYAATMNGRQVIFKTSTGTFENGKDTIIAGANSTGVIEDKKTAIVHYRSSLRAGLDTIVAMTSTIPLFSDTLILTLKKSVADSINLSASSFSVKANFESEIAITGVLFNEQDKGVSMGTLVRFNDHYENGGAVNGAFRQDQTQSDENSKVSIIYSPGLAKPNTFIFIKGTIVKENGELSPYSDSVKVYITN